MEQLALSDYLAIWRRHKISYVLTAIAIMAAAVSFAYLWPPKYRSMGTVQIEQPDIPQDVMSTGPGDFNAAVQAFVDQRIEQIHDRITATPNLIDIITKFNLYPEMRQNAPMSAAVKKMQASIQLDLKSSDLANPNAAQHLNARQLSAIAFTIGFDYSDPLVSQQVTNEVISRFLDEDLKQRHDQAVATSAFIADQIAQIEKQLSEQEKKVTDFREQHAGTRPEDLPFNMQMSASTAQTVNNLSAQMQTMDRQRGDLQAQLASTEPYSRVVDEGQLLTTPSVQLKAMKAKLTTLEGQYGADYPDVVKLKKAIAALQKQIGTDTGTSYDGKSGGAGNQGQVKDADNPAYIMLTYQLKSLEQQYKTLMDQQAEARKQKEMYDARVAATPAVEQEFASLNRDYENAQLRYRELKEKQMAASMNQQLEQDRKGERLTMIEAPDLPGSPRMPPRKIVIALGAIMAMFGGFVSVYIMEVMNSAVYGTKQLTAIIGVPPLVAVPQIITPGERRRRRIYRLAMTAGVILALVLGTTLYDQYVQPLDVLWGVISQRLGGLV
jgi:polysaccharide chain length determinant protein (PEP-CTERM system associated)